MERNILKKVSSILLLAATVAATPAPGIHTWPPPGNIDGHGMMVNPDGTRSFPSKEIMKQREEQHRQMLLREHSK
jgi:hypothetical protein